MEREAISTSSSSVADEAAPVLPLCDPSLQNKEDNKLNQLAIVIAFLNVCTHKPYYENRKIYESSETEIFTF